MRFSIAALAAILSTASANPEPAGHHYMAPGPGDVRSPCPGLNSLANHGFINRSGMNLSIPALTTGLGAGMNMGPDFTTAIGAAGLLSSPDPQSGTFSLKDIREHNFPIEHDASLSRQDAYFGNDYSFYQPNWDMVLRHFTTNKITLLQASTAKWSRFRNSKHINPNFTYGPREFVLSYGETSLYMQVMGMSPDPFVNPELAYVRVLFEEERLPYKEGWSPPTLPITLASLGAMNNNLFAANPHKAPEGVQLTVGTLQDAFEGINPITGLLGNATKGGR